MTILWEKDQPTEHFTLNICGLDTYADCIEMFRMNLNMYVFRIGHLYSITRVA